MDVERVSIENIFARLIQFEVTEGQYRWGEVQWQCLWDDISKIVAAASRLERHFLGVILLAPQTGRRDAIDRFSIVDGQQRLMTLAVLLAALRDRAAEMHEAALTDGLQNVYLSHPFRSGIERHNFCLALEMPAFSTRLSAEQIPQSVIML